MKIKSLLPIALLLAGAFQLGAQTVVTDSLELTKGVSVTPADLLRGMVAGVRVSATDGNPVGVTNTNIRGLNSIRGNNEPLWIVDGSIITNSIGENLNAFWQGKFSDYGYMSALSQMDNWNLYDIESIQVLKNTSATALYGSRGANGVIIITTKMPLEDKSSIEWDSNVGLNMSGVKSSFFQPSISHNHSVTVGASAGRTRYRLSAFFRDVNGVVSGNGSDFGGLRVLFDTKANAVVHFGMNFALSGGVQNSQYGTAWYGAPSTMLAIRNINPMDSRLNDPQGWLDDYAEDTRIFRTTDSFYLNLNFTPAFRWKNNASVDCQSNTRYIWFDKGTAFGLENNGAAGITLASLFNVDYKTSLQYEKYFAIKHHVNVEAGAEVILSINRFDTMNGTYFIYKEIKARGLSFRMSFDDPAVFEKQHVSAGGYVTLGYDYSNLAGINASVRADRNFRFDDEYILYPAVNAYADIKGLALADVDVLSSLRLEGGYGKAGFAKYIPYETFSNYTAGIYPVADDQTAAYFDGYQRLLTSEYNVTLKAGVLKDRITAGLTYYNRETADNLSMYQFGHASNSGIWVVQKKALVSEQESVIANNGLELELGAQIIKSGDFSWNLNGNIACNNNKLAKVSLEDANGLKLNPDGIVTTKNIEGQPVSSIYGNILDKTFTVVDEGIIGNSVPKIFGGLQTTLRYKAFTLEAQADYAAGHDILNMNRMLASEQLAPASSFVEKGDYLRLANVSLQYQVPVRKIDWIKSLAVSLTATNLATLTGYSGWNPDVNCFGYTNLSNGLDYGSFPMFRTIMLGVHANF